MAEPELDNTKYAVLYTVQDGSIIGFNNGRVELSDPGAMREYGPPSNEVKVIRMGEDDGVLPVEDEETFAALKRNPTWIDISARRGKTQYVFTAIFLPEVRTWALRGEPWKMPSF